MLVQSEEGMGEEEFGVKRSAMWCTVPNMEMVHHNVPHLTYCALHATYSPQHSLSDKEVMFRKPNTWINHTAVRVVYKTTITTN